MGKEYTRYLMVFLALIMWALSFPSIKFVLEEVEPLTLAAIRFIIPLPLIYLFYHYERQSVRALEKGTGDKSWVGGEGKKGEGNKGEEESQVERGQAVEKTAKKARMVGILENNKRIGAMIFIFSLTNVVLPNVFQNYGMQSTSSGVTSIIQGSGPIFTILLASIFLKENLSSPQIFGIIMALLGSILLVSGGELQFDGSTAGKILILLSAISYAVSGIFAKIILKDKHAGELTFTSFSIGAGILAICAVIVEEPAHLRGMDLVYWEHIAYISLFPTCLAFFFWFRALKHLPLSRLAISIFLVPVMAVFFSWIFLDEEVSFFTGWTGGMVIIGVVIAQLGEKWNMSLWKRCIT